MNHRHRLKVEFFGQYSTRIALVLPYFNFGLVTLSVDFHSNTTPRHKENQNTNNFVKMQYGTCYLLLTSQPLAFC